MSGYIGPLPVPQGIQRKQSFTATASQTTFNTNGYTDGDFINVYLNGVRLINGTDYTATNGSDIVLTTGASASDVLDFETFQTFQLVDQQFENVTLKNPTHEDTDGGRESAVSFKGEQSGGEVSTLAQIQASHDGTSDDQKGDLIFKTNDGSDNDAPTERARIDSSGNLFVGKTVQSIGTDGVTIVNGQITATADGADAIRLNRKTSDGSIIDLRKDGTSVGSIGNSGTALVFENPNANSYFAFHANNQSNGIFYQDGTSKVFGPYVARDDEINLGASNARFKDLYLSGGVFLGGTAAINELNDAETGTWTPVFNAAGSGATYSVQVGNYTKIGRLVHASCMIQLSALGTGSGGIRVNGLPFTSITYTNHYDATSSVHGTSWTTQTNGVQGLLNNNATHIQFYQNMCATSSGSQYTLVHTAMGTGNLLFSITYHAA